jgi:hypothetical protein
MTVTKKPTSKKAKARKSVAKPLVQPVNISPIQKVRRTIVRPFAAMTTRVKGLLARRPHRSFRRSLRRDYARSLKLPSYWVFTNNVRKVLWQHKRIFIWLVVVYGILTLALVGMASQNTYTQLGETLRSTSDQVFDGNLGEVGKASLLLITGATGSLSEPLSELQQIYAIMLVLFVWLTTVWLLRAILAGRIPRLRDGLYSAGAPVLSTFLVGLLLVVQLLPVVLALIGYGAASVSGLLDGGVESMLFWSVALLLGSLSLYWITSTFIALVVVTLPGMYPMQALKTAGDLVIGRRLRILLRLLWLALITVLLWALIMIPIILFDTWLKGVLPVIEWLPVVPIALMTISTFTVVWVASYIYLLYRRIVDDDAAPA